MKYTCRLTVIYCAVLYQDKVHIPPNYNLLCCPVPGWSTHTAKLSSIVLSCPRTKNTYRQPVIYCAVLYQDEVHIPPNSNLLCCPVPEWSTHTAKLSFTVLSCTRVKYTYRQIIIYCAVLYQDEVAYTYRQTVIYCAVLYQDEVTYGLTVIYCAVLYQDEVHIPPNCHLLCCPVPEWSTHATRLSSTVLSCTRMKYTCRQTVIYCAVLYQDEVHMPPICNLLCCPVPGWNTHATNL